MNEGACPCGSAASYDACCAPFHRGAEAPTALALMRSRYAAFAKHDAAYLVRTAHPLERTKIDARGLRASFALAWCGLEILATVAGGVEDCDGMVHFRASWRAADGAVCSLEERSRFVRVGCCWVYRDGRG